MKKEEYASWIRKVRGKMSQTEFGRHVYHYRTTRNGKVCKTYHRNEIANWELGKNLPANTETFLSIALLEYDKTRSKEFQNCTERNERYYYAKEVMNKMLGVDLYCRNLHDALLIQVCRGVISFEDVVRMEPELDEIIQQVNINTKQKRQYALQRETENIQNNFFVINNEEEIRALVRDTSIYFYTGNRTLGERMRQIYDSRQRYGKKMTLEEAVWIFAPNYRDSYTRIFFSTGITRQWLLDLCLHLRFKRDEMQEVLMYAHMAALSEYETDQEYYYREGTYAIGSAGWYQECERHNKSSFIPHFEEIYKLPLLSKMKILLLTVAYVEQESFYELPPIDYILESFALYDQGREALKQVTRLVDETDSEEWNMEIIQRRLGASVQSWMEYIRFGCDTAIERSLESVFQDYKNECREYYCIADKNLKRVSNKENANKLRYIAAVFYSVFLGKYFMGNLAEEDLRFVKAQFIETGYIYVYRFISHVLGNFLSNRELMETPEGSFRIVELKERRDSKAIDIEEIFEDLWASIVGMQCTK